MKAASLQHAVADAFPRPRSAAAAGEGGGAGLGLAALVVALEHVPAAAFVLDAGGEVIHANAVGQHRLRLTDSALRQALRQAAQGQDTPDFEIEVVGSRGLGGIAHGIALCRSRGDRVLFAVERAKARWQLTAREVDVLAEVAAGGSNRDISKRLGVIARTVELHVSSLLSKAGTSTRTQLILELWRLADGG